MVDGRSQVNEEECVECNTCYRTLRDEGRNPTLVRTLRRVLRCLHLAYDADPHVCPTGALTPPRLSWPRSLRAAFSDPLVRHQDTDSGGRGTEEIKSNDVTGRLKRGEIGFVIELGRPGLGARFRDIDRMARALAAVRVTFEKENPVTHLMVDPSMGALRQDVLDEKVLSAIIECRIDASRAHAVLTALRRVAVEMDTVFCAGIAARCDPDGSAPFREMVRESGLSLSLNAKSNLGMGRPLFQEQQRTGSIQGVDSSMSSSRRLQRTDTTVSESTTR